MTGLQEKRTKNFTTLINRCRLRLCFQEIFRSERLKSCLVVWSSGFLSLQFDVLFQCFANSHKWELEQCVPSVVCSGQPVIHVGREVWVCVYECVFRDSSKSTKSSFLISRRLFERDGSAGLHGLVQCDTHSLPTGCIVTLTTYQPGTAWHSHSINRVKRDTHNLPTGCSVTHATYQPGAAWHSQPTSWVQGYTHNLWTGSSMTFTTYQPEAAWYSQPTNRKQRDTQNLPTGSSMQENHSYNWLNTQGG